MSRIGARIPSDGGAFVAGLADSTNVVTNDSHNLRKLSTALNCLRVHANPAENADTSVPSERFITESNFHWRLLNASVVNCNRYKHLPGTPMLLPNDLFYCFPFVQYSRDKSA